jgi:hypothetical protein
MYHIEYLTGVKKELETGDSNVVGEGTGGCNMLGPCSGKGDLEVKVT